MCGVERPNYQITVLILLAQAASLIGEKLMNSKKVTSLPAAEVTNDKHVAKSHL